MRLAAKRICYSVANSNAMNGIAPGAKMVPVMPWWHRALLTAEIVSGVLLLGSVAWAVMYEVQRKKRVSQ